jgi:hypothetical protein
MVQAIVIQCVYQGLQDVFLPHHLGKFPGAPFTRQNLVTHQLSCAQKQHDRSGAFLTAIWAL